jgi:hypothetical protein
MRARVLWVGIFVGALGACSVVLSKDGLLGPPGAADAAVESTSAEGASVLDPGVFCGAATCRVPGSLCCIDYATQTSACTPSSGECSAPRAPFACDDTADCPNGMACCLYWSRATSNYTSSLCQPSCDDPLCNPGVVPDECLALDAGSCVSLGSTPNNYYSCH